jgi:hypothetical protein
MSSLPFRVKRYIHVQADAFICMDAALSRAVSGIVTVASIDDLMAGTQPRRPRPEALRWLQQDREGEHHEPE